MGSPDRWNPDKPGQSPSGNHGVDMATDPDPGGGYQTASQQAPKRRATREVLAGRRRAIQVAARLGVGLRDARLHTGRTQQECAASARLSQARWSNLERGLGASAPLATWAVAAAAAGQELVGFLDRAPGLTRLATSTICDDRVPSRHARPSGDGLSRRRCPSSQDRLEG